MLLVVEALLHTPTELMAGGMVEVSEILVAEEVDKEIDIERERVEQLPLSVEGDLNGLIQTMDYNYLKCNGFIIS